MTDSVESGASMVASNPAGDGAGGDAGTFVDVDQAPDVELESRTVELAAVAAHPANPRKDLGDLSDLRTSINEQGVLQPPVLLPADRVAAAWPEHADQLGGVEWVVLMGHRRRASAAEAGRTHMPALIRRDAIAEDPLAQLDAMVAENTARLPLTPVEEARAFAEQMAAGRTQSEVAARAGRSQGHVSKRMKLLKLPASMLAELDDGRGEDPDDTEAGGQGRQKKPRLEIGEALAYVDAAKDDRGGHDQFAILAAYKLSQHRPYWSPAQLVLEVRREQARRVQREALAKKAEAEGVPVIEDPHKKFGTSYWDHRLDGKKAIAKARKDGTLVAQITDGGLTYYSTAKPKKADNRSEAEQQRITDERERRKAMTARADAAAVLAAVPPKLPETAQDIVDAWLWAPGNDAAQLAGKWLTAAGVGPDPQLPPHRWWEQIRTGKWPVRVHAAHALALARHEVHARTTYRGWTEQDAAWLTRLIEQAGYTPTEWEQARLAAIGQDGDAGEDAPPQVVSLVFDHDGEQCWALFFDVEVDEPAEIAEHLDDPDAVDDAKAWAEPLLYDEYGLEVTGWQPGQLLKGHPALLATFADYTGHIQRDGDVLRCAGCGQVSDDIYAEGDPLKAVVKFNDRHNGCQPPAATEAAGEYRLLFSLVDDAWLLLRGDEHLADHDGLPAEELDSACSWASEQVTEDCGRQVTGWQSRAGVGDGGVEHVAELGEPATAAAAAEPAPRLAWTESDGWALHTAGGAEPVATTGPDIQDTDPVAAQAWAAEQSPWTASTSCAGPTARTGSPATPQWSPRERGGDRLRDLLDQLLRRRGPVITRPRPPLT